MVMGDFSECLIVDYGTMRITVDRNSAAVARDDEMWITANHYIDFALLRKDAVVVSKDIDA